MADHLRPPLVVCLRVSPRLRRTKDAGLSPEATERLRARLSEIDHALAVADARSRQAVIS